MGETIDRYPEQCHENISTILNNVKTDIKTAYSMLLMTAALMDLYPSDRKVVEIILDDYKGMQVISKDE